MLKRSSTESIEPIVEKLAQRQQYLQVSDSSIINELVNASISSSTSMGILGEVNTDNFDQDAVGSQTLVQDSQEQNVTGVVEHDVTMEMRTEQVAKDLNSILHFARNTVIPVANEVYDYYVQSLSDMEKHASEPVVIIENKYHPIWESYQLHSMVERYEDRPLDVYRFQYTMPKLTVAQIEQLVYTNIESFNSHLEDYLEDISRDKLLSAYEYFFVNNSYEIGRGTNARHQLEGNTLLDRNDLLLVHLIAQNMENNLDMFDNLDVPLDEFRTYISRTIEQSGRALAAELQKKDRLIRSKILVYRVDERDDELSERDIAYVNSDVYHQYLQEGGSTEALKGAVIDQRTHDYQAILDSQQELERLWYRHLGIHNQQVSSQIWSAKREAARVAITRKINEIDEQELPASKDHLHNRLLEVLGQYESKDFVEEAIALRDIVAKTLYAQYPEALMVLKAIDRSEEENPDLDVKEHVLFAVVDLMARWIARQITVEYY